nr:MAG TPA: Terminase large subunit [Bacteriophage sp.]
MGAPLEGLKKIYYNPRSFKILPFRHNWTQDGTTIESGFFIPYFLQSLNPEFMDNRGVCKIGEYKKFLQEERDNLLAVPEEYLKKCAERCWNAEEAFNLEGVNKFNKINIAN